MQYEQLSLFDFIPRATTSFEKTTEEKAVENIVKNEILKGSGFAKGKDRIIEWFSQGLSDQEIAKLLKSEYGEGGWTIVWNGKVIGHHMHNANGIDINFYEPIGKTKGFHIGYPMLVKDIRKYLLIGEYITKQVAVSDNGYISPCPYTEDCNTYSIGCNGGTYWCGRYRKED